MMLPFQSIIKSYFKTPVFGAPLSYCHDQIIPLNKWLSALLKSDFRVWAVMQGYSKVNKHPSAKWICTPFTLRLYSLMLLSEVWIPNVLLKLIFSSPSYYVWGTMIIAQIFDFRFLVDIHVLGFGESKKHKISNVSGCSLVS